MKNSNITMTAKSALILRLICAALIVLGVASLPRLYEDIRAVISHLKPSAMPYFSIGFHAALTALLVYCGIRGFRYSKGKESGTESRSACFVLLIFCSIAFISAFFEAHHLDLFSPLVLAVLMSAAAVLFMRILIKTDPRNNRLK